MRYSADQKTRARRSVIEAGARALKQGGFAGVGVDELAAAAGVTSGSVYSNFSGKEQVLEEVISAYLGVPFVDVDPDAEIDWRQRLEAFLRTYISSAHRGDPASGCVMPALSADVARSGATVRQAYQRRMSDLIEKMSRAIAGDESARRRRAWSVLALMIGAITVARALPDGPEAKEMLNAALQSALGMLNRTDTRRSLATNHKGPVRKRKPRGHP
jgi:AcrR family transcriptional regulator